jgi:hypothetical protein
MLQCHTNSRTSVPSANFGCPLCHAEYAILRRPTPPGIVPTCEDCNQEFMTRDNDDWLLYERADT